MRKRSKTSAKGISANFWLIGLYYGALCPLQDRSDCSAHGGLRADVQSIFRWGFRLGFQTGRTSGLAGNSNDKYDFPEIPETSLLNMYQVKMMSELSEQFPEQC